MMGIKSLKGQKLVTKCFILTLQDYLVSFNWLMFV